MADRQLKVTIVGDSRQLERTLGRTETRLRRFSRSATGAASAGGLGGGGILALGRGGAFAAAAGVAALGIKSITDAATNAQVILGQTSVAVDDAGLSWQKYGEQVQAASLAISKSSAFDDEQVLQSFSVFIRGQKNVAKSIQLSQLAADVARGRYVDLASATQLVNKAALGQIGALRRAGIAIDKNATAAQALKALQDAYSGSAKKFADSNAGAADKLRVAWENLREEWGGPAADAISKLARGLTFLADHSQTARAEVSDFDSVEFRKKFVDAFGIDALNQALAKLAPQIRQARQDFLDAIQPIDLTPGGGARGGRATPSFGQPGFKVGAQGVALTQIPNRLRAQELDARLGGNRLTLKGVLAQEAQVLQAALQDVRLKPGEIVSLKESLLGVTQEIQSIDDSIIQDAKDKQQAIKDAKDAQAAARKKAIEALKATAKAFKDEADSIKSAVLSAFDARQQKVENARALQDAKKALAQARQLGTPTAISQAQRDLADARFAVTRQRLEQTAFRVTGGPRGPIDRLQVGSVTIQINSNQSPEAIAKQVQGILLKHAAKSSGQQRGRRPGTNPIGL